MRAEAADRSAPDHGQEPQNGADPDQMECAVWGAITRSERRALLRRHPNERLRSLLVSTRSRRADGLGTT
jgi:hypothetical protein